MKTTTTTGCPSCSHRKANLLDATVYECCKCKAIYGNCTFGESYDYVLPYFQRSEAKEERYFDLTVIGSRGVTRRHGWFDPETRMITQTG